MDAQRLEIENKIEEYQSRTESIREKSKIERNRITTEKINRSNKLNRIKEDMREKKSKNNIL